MAETNSSARVEEWYAERVASYGELADRPNQLWGGFGQMLSSEGAPDPQDVADAVLALIQAPAGERALRVVVDPMSGVKHQPRSTR